MAMTGED
jgi:hypothetical protein